MCNNTNNPPHILWYDVCYFLSIFFLGSSYSCATSISRSWRKEAKMRSQHNLKPHKRGNPKGIARKTKIPDIKTGLRVLLWHLFFKNINKLSWISWMASWKSQMLLLFPLCFSDDLGCVLVWINCTSQSVLKTNLFSGQDLFCLIFIMFLKTEGWRQNQGFLSLLVLHWFFFHCF